MQVTDYLLKVFAKEKIPYVFLVPGGYIDPIISSLAHSPSIQAIVAAHECGAVFMADGYARASGKFGVAIGIGGPGLTNMVTGIATAYADQIPLFIVTGEAKSNCVGRGAFQDSSSEGINAGSILQSITVKKLSLNHIELTEHHIKQLLFAMLNHGRRGPVQLSIPADIQLQTAKWDYQPLADAIYQPRLLDEPRLAKLWPLLKNQSNIVILVGTGVIHSGASQALLAVAERFSIPVATTLGAKGAIPENHRLALGTFGWFGTRSANEVLLSKQVDILLVLGSKLSQMTTMSFTKDLMPRHALIINDLSESNYFANYEANLFILGDNQTFLQALLASDNNILHASKAEREQWLEQYVAKIPRFYDIENLSSEQIPIHPARVIHELQKAMPPHTILYVGEGAHGFFTTHYWQSLAPQEFFCTVKYMSPMGWSIPAAIGGKLAKPDQPVVCLTGDGSMLMHGIEIQTAARYHLPVIFIVFNNSSHGNPQLRGKRVGSFECKFLALPTHDWQKFAESLGMIGMKVTKPQELAKAFHAALAIKQTVLIEIITANEPTPTYLLDEYLYGVPSPYPRISRL